MPVDDLREQLRERGYLTHGIERWFALDPWSSRTFWLELLTVCAKASVLIGAFGMLPFTTVMIIRNWPIALSDATTVAILYGGALFGAAFVALALLALILKVRPAIVLDSPAVLLALSLLLSGLFATAYVLWWYGFGPTASRVEVIAALILTFVWFLVTTMAVSGALLSFSVHELQRVPAIAQPSRAPTIALAMLLLAAFLYIPVYVRRVIPDQHPKPPLQVITQPTQRRLAFIAVDGLTEDIFQARRDLTSEFAFTHFIFTDSSPSAPERWATIGTGVHADLHGVRGVEGVRLPGSGHLLQRVSIVDLVLRNVGAREPLPPTVRRRDYVWEIFAGRAVPSLSVNWWTTDDVHAGVLEEIGQAPIFNAARGNPLAVDAAASKRFLDAIDRTHPQFATVYLPALDITVNRLNLEQGARVSGAVRALAMLHDTIAAVRQRGYEVILIGSPGDRQKGSGVLATTFPLDIGQGIAVSAYDVAPMLCSIMGFPASGEMHIDRIVKEPLPRIASYGERARSDERVKVNEEYYQNLKSLGYIR